MVRMLINIYIMQIIPFYLFPILLVPQYMILSNTCNGVLPFLCHIYILVLLHNCGHLNLFQLYMWKFYFHQENIILVIFCIIFKYFLCVLYLYCQNYIQYLFWVFCIMVLNVLLIFVYILLLDLLILKMIVISFLYLYFHQ